MGSPFYAALLIRAAIDFEAAGAFARLFDKWAGNRLSVLGIRLMAAFHYIALSNPGSLLAQAFPSTGGSGNVEAAFDAMLGCLSAESDCVGQLLQRAPQTNEVARSIVLMPGFLAVSERFRFPLALFEVGTSAGLNLCWDRYRYSGEGWSWGLPASELVLLCDSDCGTPTLPDASVEIISRSGCDLNPLDPTKPADMRELQSFVWADQTARLGRLVGACTIAAQTQVERIAGDAVSWVGTAASPRRGVGTVVFHSVVTEHMPPPARNDLQQAIHRCAEEASWDAPFAWLRMELAAGNSSAGYETRLTLWPSGEEKLIATSTGHASAVVWA